MRSVRNRILIALLSLTAGGTALAASNVVSVQRSQMAAPLANATIDFAAAKPMMPRINSAPLPKDPMSMMADTLAAMAAAPAPSGGREAREGGRKADHLATKIPKSRFVDADGMSPQAVGTTGLPFTTSRSAASLSVMKQWPFRATGKLYFTDGVYYYVCSASLIGPGVVVTAGHCMSNGNGGWYGGFTYVPAYRNGDAPYGVWSNWATAVTSTDWHYGGGGVPNLHDFGVVMFNTDGSGYNVGDYTGYLGYTNNWLIGRHITHVGYPCNMYSCEYQMRTDTQTWDIGTNNAVWGSDQRGGSSGSPLVVNFRSAYDNSNAFPSQNSANRVAGVVSWGYVAIEPMAQGGSVFDTVMDSVYSLGCSLVPSAC